MIRYNWENYRSKLHIYKYIDQRVSDFLNAKHHRSQKHDEKLIPIEDIVDHVTIYKSPVCNTYVFEIILQNYNTSRVIVETHLHWTNDNYKPGVKARW